MSVRLIHLALVVASLSLFASSGLAQRSLQPAVSSPVVSSAITDPGVLLVDYFRTDPIVCGDCDDPVQVVNPGTSGGNLCVDVYVLTPDEELNECCGCLITPDQLLEFRGIDLASNPGPSNEFAHNGAIKIISSAPASTAAPSSVSPFGVCDPGAPIPVPTLVAWETRVRRLDGVTPVVVEDEFQYASLSSTELTSLTTRCAFYEANFSGHGTCNCPKPPSV